MYAPFSMVFPEESGRQPLSFQLNPRNRLGLSSGPYQIHDIYPALQEPPVYEVFLNLANAQNEIQATLFCQLDTERQEIHLSLSEMHLQRTLAPELLLAVEELFQQPQGQAWIEVLVQRAEQMQAAFLEQLPALSVASAPPEEMQLLKTEALHMLLTQYQDPQEQEAILETLLTEIRQLMLQELNQYRQTQAQKDENKIIPFPLERRQASPEVHWLDLRLELMDLPQIWRRIRIPDQLSLSQLHRVLQVCMGWNNSHLWRFVHSRGEYVSYGELDQIWEDELNADTVYLRDLLVRKGSRLDYEYDFGDSWYHVLKVEQRHKPGALSQPKLTCLEGAGACPPEDCGGYFGYQEILKALKKKRRSKGDKELLSWLGAYDPEHFEKESINLQLQQISADFS